jgi:hypothetical protein
LEEVNIFRRGDCFRKAELELLINDFKPLVPVSVADRAGDLPRRCVTFGEEETPTGLLFSFRGKNPEFLGDNPLIFSGLVPLVEVLVGVTLLLLLFLRSMDNFAT